MCGVCVGGGVCVCVCFVCVCVFVFVFVCVCGGGGGGALWLIAVDIDTLLVPFDTLLAPDWHPFDTLLQLFGKFAGLSRIPRNSTFVGSQMLGPAECSTH